MTEPQWNKGSPSRAKALDGIGQTLRELGQRVGPWGLGSAGRHTALPPSTRPLLAAIHPPAPLTLSHVLRPQVGSEPSPDDEAAAATERRAGLALKQEGEGRQKEGEGGGGEARHGEGRGEGRTATPKGEYFWYSYTCGLDGRIWQRAVWNNKRTD